jgi:hypothetical protein
MTIVGVPGESVAGERRALGDERHMYARNVQALLELLTDDDGNLAPGFDDEVVAGACVVREKRRSAPRRRWRLSKVLLVMQQRPAVAQDGPAPTSSNGAVTAAKGGAR